MSLALNIYHKLPPFSRSFAASLRGYYLNWWRYGKETEKLVEGVLERDYWSKREWSEWQQERLSVILQRAATRVPFYRQAWAERRRRGDRASWDYLENWTILEKQTLRGAARDFVADDCAPAKMFHDHTSGTTGASLDLWLKKETVKLWYAIFEARSRRWYNLTRQDRWAIIGGQLVVPVRERKPPFWIWNAGLNQLYMSAYHLAPEMLGSYLDALVKYRVKYILGYSSALYSLAKEALRRNDKRLKLDVVITNAEPLSGFQREAIEAAFSCPVRETYGMAEIVAAGGECENGKLHQWSDVGVVETDEQTQEADSTGDFICTGLINADMPLIRYRVGDRGSLSAEACECGRSLPLFRQIEGRRDDVIYSADGRQIGRLDPIFKSNMSIAEAQIIQETLKLIKIKYVPDHDFNQSVLDVLRERLCERVGDVEVLFEQVREIPRTSRGKFRAVICNLSSEERSQIQK